MIQFPIYTPITSYQNGTVYYPSQPVNQCQGANVFYPAPQTNIRKELESVHKTFYPDLTKEEFDATESVRNEMLYKAGKLEQLAKYGTYTNCGTTYSNIKDNQDFKELINSKYFKSAKDFVKIINNLNSLELQRQKKIIPKPPIYGFNAIQFPSLPYHKYDLNDYVRMLNNFAKNDKISDDLKQYILYKESDKLDLYYTKLDILDKSNNPLVILTENF